MRYRHCVTSHLVGAAEIAEMLNVSTQRLDQLIEVYPDFPQPEVVLKGGRIWAREAVEEWVRQHPARKPGRPRKRRLDGVPKGLRP
jgi:predicted DNA-binding transcriptional regulator AlpA